MIVATRVRVYPAPEIAALFARSAGCARLVANLAIEQRILAYRVTGESVGYVAQANELPELKRTPGLEFLREVHSDVLQQALRDVDRAFRNFFQGRAGFPRFKRKGRDRDSFRIQCHKTGEGRHDIAVRRLNRHWGEIRIPKAGWVRFRWTRPIRGQIKHITVTRDPLGWHVSICHDDAREKPRKRETGPVIGIDAGVVHSFTASTGETMDVPQVPRGERARRLRLERKLARQVKGSRRRERTKHALAKLRARETRRRHDAIHKFTTQLTREHRLIAIEDLQVTNMTRSAKGTLEEPGVNVRQKAGLNRAILAQGWGLFRAQLEYKTAREGVELVVVPAAFTSQTCNACGHLARENRENQAVFSCVACGHELNADHNAAINILARGLKQLTGAGQALTAQGAFQEHQGNELRTTRSPVTVAA